MVRTLAFFCVISLAIATPSSAGAVSVRDVFSAHDPNSRLPNTKIRELGAVRVKGATYSIYYLTFVNPISRHGQHRIAIIRNGDEFAGAYQCWLEEGGAKLVIGEDRLTVYVDELKFVIQFDEKGPTKNRYFCGEGSGWENSI